MAKKWWAGKLAQPLCKQFGIPSEDAWSWEPRQSVLTVPKDYTAPAPQFLLWDPSHLLLDWARPFRISVAAFKLALRTTSGFSCSPVFQMLPGYLSVSVQMLLTYGSVVFPCLLVFLRFVAMAHHLVLLSVLSMGFPI